MAGSVGLVGARPVAAAMVVSTSRADGRQERGVEVAVRGIRQERLVGDALELASMSA